ncbi:helix-turn-helix domain-containing protein [Fructobacillus parabroussonetiae]|uniref:Helix-turn-helix transcriptional regulator n=1 Tax=Fructobacillus parabroussonetiae TaxID=2713174 RepID=A0ABS5QWF1_9LACO|nr:helix-turn-helix transcriptional regulator [Fructobacillus parabroussonetiae]MBS9336890.1 helix-turn-helix transcriptional regulator [Fructobacillus parabroussonetiae]
MEFGKRLQKLRQEKGITQEQLAKQFYTSRQNISSWENGKTYPNMKDLIYLSDFFGVSLDVFLKEDGQVQESLEKATVKKLLTRVYVKLTISLLLLLFSDVAQDFLKVPLQAEVWLIVFFIIVSAANNIEEFNKEFGIKVIYPWQRHLRK